MVFNTTDDGDVAPLYLVAGSSTGLTGPAGDDNSFLEAACYDRNGNYWGTQDLSDVGLTFGVRSLIQFPDTANGNVPNTALISGAATGFPSDVVGSGGKSGICVDGSGNIYAGILSTIYKFPPGSTGNVAPTTFVNDASFGTIGTLWFDAQRQWIWVGFNANYNSSHNPNLSPVDYFIYGGEGFDGDTGVPGIVAYDLSGVLQRDLRGSPIHLPFQVTTDTSGNIYCVDYWGNQLGSAGFVQVYDAAANGVATPARVIDGAATTLVAPTGIAVDSDGTIYVCDIGEQNSLPEPTVTPSYISFVAAFAAGASGNVAPIRKIIGANTSLSVMPNGTATGPYSLDLVISTPTPPEPPIPPVEPCVIADTDTFDYIFAFSDRGAFLRDTIVGSYASLDLLIYNPVETALKLPFFYPRTTPTVPIPPTVPVNTPDVIAPPIPPVGNPIVLLPQLADSSLYLPTYWAMVSAKGPVVSALWFHPNLVLVNDRTLMRANQCSVVKTIVDVSHINVVFSNFGVYVYDGLCVSPCVLQTTPTPTPTPIPPTPTPTPTPTPIIVAIDILPTFGLSQSMISANATSWAQFDLPEPPDANEEQKFDCIAYAPELALFAAGSLVTTNGYNIATSPDGQTWTYHQLPDTVLNSAILDIAWSPTLNLFAAVTSDPNFVKSTKVYTSPDGANWTAQTCPQSASTVGWTTICWSPSLGKFCATNDGNTVSLDFMTSANGTLWTTTHTEALGNDGQTDICWADTLGLFVAVVAGSSGSIFDVVLTSPDGAAWTKHTLTTQNAYGQVCWSDTLGLLVATTNTGPTTSAVMTSPDGANWTVQTTPSVTIEDVVWVDDLALFVGALDNGAITSPNGTAWTEQTTPTLPVNTAWIAIAFKPAA